MAGGGQSNALTVVELTDMTVVLTFKGRLIHILTKIWERKKGDSNRSLTAVSTTVDDCPKYTKRLVDSSL